MVFVKIGNYSLFFFFIFGKMNQKNEFQGILERNSAFLDPQKKQVQKNQQKLGFFRRS